MLSSAKFYNLTAAILSYSFEYHFFDFQYYRFNGWPVQFLAGITPYTLDGKDV